MIVALLGVLVGGLVFAGCQSNPEPPPLETESPSPSATPSPSPTEAAPTLPPEANGANEAAAKAFVRHYFDSLNHAVNSGDTSYFSTLGARSCESCKAIASNVDDTYRAGGHIASKGWVVQSIHLVPLQPPGRPILDLGVLLRQETVVARQGADPETFRGGKQPMTIHLARSDDSWIVIRLDQVG